MNGIKRSPYLTPVVCICLLMVFASAACKKSQTAGKANTGEKSPEVESHLPPQSGKLYKQETANCNRFTAEDAAGILGVPASKVEAKTEELYAGNWQCTFESGDLGKTISFNVNMAKSVEEAAREMQQYRGHLETAGGVSPFKENLPKGAYSDISGIGDEAVWTDMNDSLAVRQGNVTVHVTMPKDKAVQLKVAEKFLAKLG